MNISLTERVKVLAKERGFSARKIEQTLGFSDKSIFKWDKNKPSIDKVEAVARLLGVSVDSILGFEIPDGDNYEVVAKLERMTAEDVRLVKLFNKATDEDKKVIQLILTKYEV